MTESEINKMAGNPVARQSVREEGLLVQEWADFCGVLDDPSLDWESRFARISARMDQIDTALLPGHLKCPIAECYRRTVIGALHNETEAGFEAVLSHWRLRCMTPIHGHPPIVFYRALSGLYRMTMYQIINGVPAPVDDRMICAGEWFFHVGEGGGFDHFIHTIECIEEGWTLNLYSDDAQKGIKYNQ